MKSEYYMQFICKEDNRISVVIDDNSSVCYAYLIKNNNIIGDVWLYNQEPSPKFNEWEFKNEGPFLNPELYVSDEYKTKPLKEHDSVELKWGFSRTELVFVEIYFDNRLVAVITPESKPGWSIFAKKNGPLAKVLNENVLKSIKGE